MHTGDRVTIGFELADEFYGIVNDYGAVRVFLVHGHRERGGEIVECSIANGFGAHLDDASAAAGCGSRAFDDLVVGAVAGDEVAPQVEIGARAGAAFGKGHGHETTTSFAIAGSRNLKTA